jgi:hypothetical protein
VTQRRRCVFCGTRKVSREHVIPKWVGKVLPRSPESRWLHTSESDSSSERWETDALSFTVKRVCRPCNHGWMETEIEVPARPILTPKIQGRPTELTPVAQERVATWAVKTHMMAQYRHKPLRPVIEEQRQWLFENKNPLPKSRVWLAAYVGHLRHGAWGRVQNFSLFAPESPEVGPADVFDAEMMTLCIGHLVLQSFKWSGAVEEFELSLPDSLGPFVTPIWPPSPLILTWPPSWTIDNEESLSNFADSFTRTGEPP